MSGSKSVDASSPPPLPSPLIVAKGKLVNQTAPIPTTTIFTPYETGLYRMSLYMTTTQRNSSSNQSWNFNLSWTDDAGAETVWLLADIGAGNLPQAYGTNPYYGTWPGQVITFEAVAGFPVTYSVTQNAPDDSAYSQYFVVERIE
jgi:hypothetical protein